MAVLTVAQAGGAFAASVGATEGFSASAMMLRAQRELFIRQTLEQPPADD